MVIVEVGHFDLLCVMQVGEREIYEISRENQIKEKGQPTKDL